MKMKTPGIMPVEDQDWMSQVGRVLSGWVPLYHQMMTALGYNSPVGMQNTPMTQGIMDEYDKMAADAGKATTPYSRAGTKEGIQQIVMERFGFTTPQQYAAFVGTDIGQKYIDELRKARLNNKE